MSWAQADQGQGQLAPTTAKRFRESLSSLMLQLGAATASFIHCVMSNEHAQPRRFEPDAVARQLRALGTSEAIQLLGLGFCSRPGYAQLCETTESAALRAAQHRNGAAAHVLAGCGGGVALLGPRLSCEVLLYVAGVPQGDYRLGVHRLFLRRRAADRLERVRHMPAAEIAPMVCELAPELFASLSRAHSRAQAVLGESRAPKPSLDPATGGSRLSKIARVAYLNNRTLRVALYLGQLRRLASARRVIERAALQWRGRLALRWLVAVIRLQAWGRSQRDMRAKEALLGMKAAAAAEAAALYIQLASRRYLERVAPDAREGSSEEELATAVVCIAALRLQRAVRRGQQLRARRLRTLQGSLLARVKSHSRGARRRQLIGSWRLLRLQGLLQQAHANQTGLAVAHFARLG